jgi:hypothetical protein
MLKNDVVRLVPFIPRLHLAPLWDAGISDPGLWPHMGHSPATKEVLLGRLMDTQRDPSSCTFLAIDTTRPGEFGGAIAGLLWLFGASPTQRVRLLETCSHGQSIIASHI